MDCINQPLPRPSFPLDSLGTVWNGSEGEWTQRAEFHTLGSLPVGPFLCQTSLHCQVALSFGCSWSCSYLPLRAL